jgi:Glycosyl hydrolases family 16
LESSRWELNHRTAKADAISTNNGSGRTIDTPLSNSWLGSAHRYRIDWNPYSIVYSIDGSVVVSHSLTVSAALRPLISDLNVGGGNLAVSSIEMSTPVLSTDLSGNSLPAGWSSSLWSNAGFTTVADGMLTVDGARAGTDALFSGRINGGCCQV